MWKGFSTLLTWFDSTRYTYLKAAIEFATAFAVTHFLSLISPMVFADEEGHKDDALMVWKTDFYYAAVVLIPSLRRGIVGSVWLDRTLFLILW